MRADSFLSTPTRLRRRTPRRLLHCSSHCPPVRPLIALDSDGTVLDSMRPKHERCFAPLFAEYFALGAPREALAEVWLFVNLGSRNRGINRYRALSAALRLLAGHPRIGRPRGLWARVGSALDLWLAAESVPSRASLERAAAPGGTFPALGRVLEWSLAVDASIASLPPPPAFEGARNFIASFKDVAELMVLSAAPRGAAERTISSATSLKEAMKFRAPSKAGGGGSEAMDASTASDHSRTLPSAGKVPPGAAARSRLAREGTLSAASHRSRAEPTRAQSPRGRPMRGCPARSLSAAESAR